MYLIVYLHFFLKRKRKKKKKGKRKNEQLWRSRLFQYSYEQVLQLVLEPKVFFFKKK